MALQFFLRSSRAARQSFYRDVLTRRFDLRTMTFSSSIRNTLFCEKPPKGFEKFFRDKPGSKKEIPKEEPKSSNEAPKQSKTSERKPPPDFRKPEFRNKTASSGSSSSGGGQKN